MDDSMLAALAAAVQGRSVSAVELVDLAFARIEALDPGLNAFTHLDPDNARAAARGIDQRVVSGEVVGPLAGVPFAVKDLEDAVGMPTGKGSRWYTGGGPATRDDLHVARLRAAGAIPIGKTAVPEFGSAPFTASAVHGVTRNPWALDRTPGGSSGGSAAAVVTGMVPFATASDGGGSIRAPAGFTALPGLRPSYGRVPTYGSTHAAQNAVNFALAPGVADTALLLDVCAGADRRDRTSLPTRSGSYRHDADNLEVRGLRATFSRSFGLGPVDPDVERLTRAAFEVLSATAGLEVVDLDVQLPSYFDVYRRVEGLDQWIDLPDGLWPERASELTPALQPGWASASRARLPQLAGVFTERRRLEQQVAALYDEIDVLVTPTTGVVPFGAAGPIPDEIAGAPVHPFIGLAQPILASLCNLPSMSVPAGLTPDGLPVGLLLNASLHRDDVCLRLARRYEQATTWPVHPARTEGFAQIAGR